MSKYKKIFSYTLNWSEQVFVSKKAENTVSRTCEIVGTFERELWKSNQAEFRVEKVNKRKSSKLYVISNGFGNLFNGWIDKKDVWNELFSRNI